MIRNKLVLTTLAVVAMTVSGAAFACPMGNCTGEGGPRGKDKAGQFFARADADGDGKVSKEEHLAMAEQRFEMMDTDGDGYITKEEMQEKMQMMQGSRRGQGKGKGFTPPPSAPEGEDTNNNVE